MALKSRYYETMIKEKGFEVATKHVLMEIIEQHNQIESLMIQQAQAFDSITDQLGMVMKVAEKSKNIAEQMRKQLRPDLQGVIIDSEPVKEN